MEVTRYECLNVCNKLVVSLAVRRIMKSIHLGTLLHRELASGSEALRPPRSGRNSQVGGGAGIGLRLSGFIGFLSLPL